VEVASGNGKPTRPSAKWDFTAEVAENAENDRKQGNGTKTTAELDSKVRRSSPFSAFSASSAVKK
jgi:hypothetical protein